MNKKIIIALIVVIAIVAIGAFVLFSNINQTISYENTLNVTLPSSFQTTEDKNGSVTEAFPEDKSYIVSVSEETPDITASTIDSTWTFIKDGSSIYKDNMTVKDYNIGNNKYYDASISGKDHIKETYQYDAEKIRFIDIVIPGKEKVYTIYFATNDTSVDLDNADIQSIINSTATS